MLNSPFLFLNEVKFSLKQGGLLYLLFLYPLLVIAIVGYAFNAQPSITVPMGIYSEDPSFTDTLAGYQSFQLFRAQSAGEAESYVRQGIVPASFIITRCGFYYGLESIAGQQCDKRIYIVMVQDPSRATEVSFLKMIFDSALMEQVSASATQIVDVQARANSLRNDLPLAIDELSNTRGLLMKEEQELAAVNSSINLDEIEKVVEDMNSLQAFMGEANSESVATANELEMLKQNISLADRALSYDFQAFSTKLESVRSGLLSAEAKRNSYSFKLAAYDQRLSNAISYADSAYVYANTAYSAAPSTASYNALHQILTARNELYSTRNDLQAAKAELDSINFTSLNHEVVAAQNYLSTMQMRVGKASSDSVQRADLAISKLNNFSTATFVIFHSLESAKSRASQIHSSASQAKSRTSELRSGIGDAISKTYETQEKLTSSNNLLRKFTAISPEDFVPPKIEESKFINSRSRLLFTFPFLIMVNIALFAVLFPIVMTSKLQENGVEDRLRQGAGPFSYTIGRFAGDYAIVAFQTMLFFMFAIAIFNVVSIFTYQIFLQAATILIVAVPFTALGFLLSRLVKKVATGLLVSLLIFIPMIFLSGKLLPLSFMDLPIRVVGGIQLFTVSLSLLELSFFRCSMAWCGLVNYAAGLLYIAAISFFFLGLSLLLWHLGSSPGRARFSRELSSK